MCGNCESFRGLLCATRQTRNCCQAPTRDHPPVSENLLDEEVILYMTTKKTTTALSKVNKDKEKLSRKETGSKGKTQVVEASKRKKRCKYQRSS